MKNKISVLAVGLLVFFVLLTPTHVAAFSDVAANVSYADAVAYVSQRGIIEGYSDGEFKPNNTVTRGQISAMICRLVGESENLPVNGNLFSDMPTSVWCNGYVTKAVSLNIINGFQDGTFRPNHVVSYNQAIAMLLRAFGLRGEAESAGGYPNGYWTVANQYGFLDGVSTKSPSNAGIRRYEVAVIIYNYIVSGYMSSHPQYPAETAVSDIGYSIPKFLVEKDIAELEGQYLPRVTFYQNGSCDITMNMAYEMDTFSASYEVFRTDSGTRIIACNGSPNSIPRPVYFVETARGWMYEGPQLGFTMQGGIFSPLNSEEINLSGEEIHDFGYETYLGDWNGIDDNGWTVGLEVTSISDGIITFNYGVLRGWGEDNLTAVMEPNGVAYGWIFSEYSTRARVKLSFLRDSIRLDFYDISTDSMLGQGYSGRDRVTMIFNQRGYF